MPAPADGRDGEARRRAPDRAGNLQLSRSSSAPRALARSIYDSRFTIYDCRNRHLAPVHLVILSSCHLVSASHLLFQLPAPETLRLLVMLLACDPRVAPIKWSRARLDGLCR